ncbi:hypothetical protein ODZ83_10770 [Acaricomes phytoseiuli]|uniref:DUF6941 family protein n=1 Tax=Acaricomes phytoseiuli TaxID=291968 RepID=UPI002221F46A|nr:hypothetical protein [Acaricomes phytoseiuli]MCW1250645.1 hypothetical protein [Acaricomes phytoseiuli]
MDIPELDYAFLAEFASIQNGTLTAVGASYTTIRVPEFPFLQDLYVAGRVRKPAGHGVIPIEAVISTPTQGDAEIGISGALSPKPNELPYDGKVGTFFVIHTYLQLNGPGLYVINLEIDGRPARRLAFESLLIAEP